MNFVYMTETLAALGAAVNPFTSPYRASEIPGIDGINELSAPKQGAAPGGWVGRTPDTECFDASGNRKASKECDQELFGGSSLVDPCWVLNEYPGLTPYTEGGHQKVIAGEIPLLRGAYKAVKTTMGWGFHGTGAWPFDYQGARIDLINVNGSIACSTYGWTMEACRNPAGAFPLNLPPCYGEQIGGERSNPDVNPMSTMWARFKTCMQGEFPECNEGA